jgi:hypothetical protein
LPKRRPRAIQIIGLRPQLILCVNMCVQKEESVFGFGQTIPLRELSGLGQQTL